jgi:hypothetical protein
MDPGTLVLLVVVPNAMTSDPRGRLPERQQHCREDRDDSAKTGKPGQESAPDAGSLHESE